MTLKQLADIQLKNAIEHVVAYKRTGDRRYVGMAENGLECAYNSYSIHYGKMGAFTLTTNSNRAYMTTHRLIERSK